MSNRAGRPSLTDSGARRSVYGQPGRPATVSIAIFHDPGVPTDSVLLTCSWNGFWNGYPKGEVPLLLDNRVHMDTERLRVARTRSSPVKTR